MTKFTEGKWFVKQMKECNSIYSVHYTVPASEYSQASITLYNQDNSGNAHLIAAAPDMYGMLESIAKNMLTTDGGCIEDMLAIEMLLKKARGE